MAPNEPETDDERQLHQLLEERGILDVEAGLEAAATYFRAFLRSCLPLIGGDINPVTMGLLSMLTRAQAFHDGATAMIHEDNPFAAYALIRCYAENAAALVWIAEKPHDARRLALAAGEDEKLVVGRVVGFAATKVPGFKNLYRQLSEIRTSSGIQLSRGLAPGRRGRAVRHLGLRTEVQVLGWPSLGAAVAHGAHRHPPRHLAAATISEVRLAAERVA